jgi:transketolase
VLKPYGEALVALARARADIICLGADLTRQTETDIFRDAIPERFINVGMAEANMIGIAGGLARAGHTVFVNSFGVFCTRRCFDQIAMAVAYPALNVKIVGFMPGLSSPGGPSHQAIEDVALMRALPNMTVVDPADAVEIAQAVPAVAEIPGPVYLRLKRGEIPQIFEADHRLDLRQAQIIDGSGRDEVCIVAAGMMIPAALAAARTLREVGVATTVINAPVIKPLDETTILQAARHARIVVSAENHTVVGGLGSAVAETLACAGVATRLLRVGIADRFAESGSREFLFARYGLGTQDIVNAAWQGLARNHPAPEVPTLPTTPGAYSPV